MMARLVAVSGVVMLVCSLVADWYCDTTVVLLTWTVLWLLKLLPLIVTPTMPCPTKSLGGLKLLKMGWVGTTVRASAIVTSPASTSKRATVLPISAVLSAVTVRLAWLSVAPDSI